MKEIYLLIINSINKKTKNFLFFFIGLSNLGISSGAPLNELASGNHSPSKKSFIFTTDWFSYNIPKWQQIFQSIKFKKINVLEIGAFEGRATVWMLENLLLNPHSRITVIDNFVKGSEEVFRHNIAKTGKKDLVQIVANNSREALAYLISKGKASFDFIYIDGAHDTKNVLNDAVLAWSLLEPQGILIFDDYDLDSVEIAVKAFLSCYKDDITVISTNRQLVIKKNRGGINDHNIDKILSLHDENTDALDLSDNKIQGEGIREIAENFPKLEKLDISRNQVKAHGALEIAKHMSNLTYLNLEENWIQDQGTKAIARKLHRLTKLNLNDNHIGDQGCIEVGNHLLNLIELEMRENKIGYQGAKQISRNLKNLRSLDLHSNQVGTNGAIEIATHLPNIQTLDLGFNQIGIAGVEAIAKSLKNLSTLKLRGNNVGDEGVGLITNHSLKLQTLDLRQSGITDLGAQAIAENLQGLTKLNLRDNAIGDKGIEAIAKNLKQLCILDIRGNKISDVGAKAIAKHLHTLTHLDIRENMIGEEGLAALVNSLPHLVHLDIRSNKLGEEVDQIVNRLKSKNPDIHISYLKY